MTVTRRSSRAEERPQSTSLGRVLVTIDDLRALCDLLRTEQFTGDSQTMVQPVMEFRGGTFDDPDDLQQLTDDELKHITVKARRMEIVLSLHTARMIGTRDLSEQVGSSWARSRQTKRRPTLNRGARWRTRAANLCKGLIGVGVLSAIGVLIVAGYAKSEGLLWWHGILFLALWISGVTWFMIDEEEKEYAVILPVTLAQSRVDDQSRQRHLQNALLALCSVTVALVGVVVVILIRN